MKTLLACLIAFVTAAGAAAAGSVTVAVSENFLSTAQKLAKDFTDKTGDEVVISDGSTGALYAQIVNGAPFDIFLAADAARPQALEKDGLTAKVAPYAVGRLVLVSRVPVDAKDAAPAFAGRTVALADPLVAPYGLAATRAMERLHLDTATFRPVLVANVGQVAAIFSTGNADLAFVSAAQVGALNPPYQLTIDTHRTPILQEAALLKRAAGNPTAQAFWDMLFSPPARAAIEAAGYALPQ